MTNPSFSKFEDKFHHNIPTRDSELSIVPVINLTNHNPAHAPVSNDCVQTKTRTFNERSQDRYIANKINFSLTDKHISQINDLNLGIHISTAILAIDILVNDANAAIRLSLNDAVNFYCTHQQNSYNLWLLKVQEFAKKHDVSVANIISILNDVASFNELHWALGIKRSYVSKFKEENNHPIHQQKENHHE